MFADELEKFQIIISPEKTRIIRRPKIVLIFGGGPIGIEADYRYSSFRNAFLNWTHENRNPLVDCFQLPEYFHEWNHFENYPNLVEFERDAGALSSAILLFSESYGSLAELGVFCMDDVLSERLQVVIRREHYQQESFVVFGPLRKLIDTYGASSVCVIDAKTVEQFYDEAAVVAEILQEKVNDHPKKEGFLSTRIRDQLLLIADVVDLFGALTESEVIDILKFMNVEIDRKTFRKFIGQLKRFKLIEDCQQYNQKYLIAPKENRQFYLDYTASEGARNFDRSRFKILVSDLLKKDSRRNKAYIQVHGEYA
ncbi:retron St85 family effector protein [Alcaligenes parafaecalis]|uniref:Retron St85 family effector protein n=1 Tax=Alcaligenes parafaecalis TaxID=171260 RepID=A0ABT3VJ76_9BURK|nr:retron St85 family effector protein [Alcaligenes parafaecalis]MCX5463141.1 retron St85 family effector protein [Alcaligenes parafaecalis]